MSISRWGVLESFRKNRSKYITTILYEDIEGNPERELVKLLNALDIPSYNITSVMEGMKVKMSLLVV